jgi:polyisoprenoid-binding protein YceI
MNKDGIVEYAGIGLFILLAIVAGGGIGGKLPEDLQMARVIEEEPATKASGHEPEASAAVTDATPETAEPAVEMATYELSIDDTAIDATGYSLWGEQMVIFDPAGGTFAYPEGDFEKGKLQGTVNMDLMIHESQLLIDHIGEESFFNIEEFPEASFESSSIKKMGAGYEIIGKLTVKGKAKSIALAAEITEDDDTITISSKNTGISAAWWDLKYKGVKDKILLNIELVFNKG